MIESAHARAPECVRTARLLLRRAGSEDAALIFTRYASDPVVCHRLAWRRHGSLADTLEYLAFSDEQWRRWPAGPYLVFDAAGHLLLGSTGLAFESLTRASTGYVFAGDAWGRGHATESLAAMIAVARDLGVDDLYAHCHTDHAASRRVLEKSGFRQKARLREHVEFPNDQPGVKQDVFLYSMNPLAG